MLADKPFMHVLARRMWDLRHIPILFRTPLIKGRLLVISSVCNPFAASMFTLPPYATVTSATMKTNCKQTARTT